jgi:hypothetical protein
MRRRIDGRSYPWIGAASAGRGTGPWLRILGGRRTGSRPGAATARRLHLPIHTVALGRLDTTIPNPNPFGPPLWVPPDPETLARIAHTSGGRAFTAEDADQLINIYKTLGSRLGVKKQPKEISASFSHRRVYPAARRGRRLPALGRRLP